MPALSAVLFTFSFQFSLLFFNISLTSPHQSLIYGSGPHQHCSVLLDNTNVAENLGKSLSDAQRTSKGKDIELIVTLKVEIKHPVGGHVAVSFRYL